jgi:hypothetical protein
MPTTLLRAHLTDQELTVRKQARTDARRTLPNPAAPLACTRRRARTLD